MPPNPATEYLRLYRALCQNPPTFGSIMRARLLAILHRKGKTLTGVAAEMGRGRMAISRRLNVTHNEPRALAAADVDAILGHLKLTPAQVLEPVLHDTRDTDLLFAIAAAMRFDDDGRLIGGATLEELDEHFDQIDLRLARLAAQALVDRHWLLDPGQGRALAVTELGQDHLVWSRASLEADTKPIEPTNTGDNSAEQETTP